MQRLVTRWKKCIEEREQGGVMPLSYNGVTGESLLVGSALTGLIAEVPFKSSPGDMHNGLHVLPSAFYYMPERWASRNHHLKYAVNHFA